jgi:diguanylate cyclase (GGDEF)-like protein
VEVSTTAAPHEDGRHFTLIVRDLRERKQHEQRLRHQATHDSLTGLPNRVHLIEELQRRIATPTSERLAVLVLNLTRFKEVNDTLGHAAGDVVLSATAHRLDAVVAGNGLIARMDGDEFAAITGFTGEREDLAVLARDLVAALRKPIVFEGVPIGVGINIGIACHPQDGIDAATLIKHADIAMYDAKRNGEEVAFYDPEQDQHSLRRLALLGELRAAMESDRLELYYQPQVSLATGKVEGVEALLRWNHPVHGFISPGEIIPLIERTDMLRPLTDWTIGRALAQQQAWARQGIDVRMAVNLSARVLQDLKFPDRLAALLATHPAAQGLELEITESATMLHVDRALAVGRRIRELGVQLSVDDYGTGHSSLSYLRDLSVTALKLDRTFVEDLENRLDNQVIVESTLALAHALRLTVVAEGVSTAWQVQYLRRLGYDCGQGFFFSPALPPANCLAWIRTRNAEAGDQARVA